MKKENHLKKTSQKAGRNLFLNKETLENFIQTIESADHWRMECSWRNIENLKQSICAWKEVYVLEL